MVQRATQLPGSPIVLSDDIEMGALASFGDLPSGWKAALAARNHGVLVCKAFDRSARDRGPPHRDDMATDSPLSTRLFEMAACMSTLRRELCRGAAAIPAPDDTTVEQLWERRAAQPADAPVSEWAMSMTIWGRRPRRSESTLTRWLDDR